MMEKRVLITGGTKGIGRAVAECLAKAGYSLILTYASDKEEALRVADGLLQQYKVEVLTLQADISDRKSIEMIESFLTGCSMRLDAVIFNAGLTCRDSFEELDIVEWERVFFANVHFPVFLLQRIVGLINKGGSSRTPANIFSKVDLPAPFFPIRAIRSFSLMTKDISENNALPPNSTVSPSTEII